MDELGLTVSIGVSFNKTLAKLGSDMKKPDAITVLDEAHWRERVWPLPASELLFVGRSTTRKLMDRCIYTIGDMAHADPALMQSWFGKNGLELWAFANGMERHRVMPIDFVSPVKSVGHGITCNCDLKRGEDVWKVILELSQDIGHRLRIHKLAARGVKLFVRDNGLNFVPSHEQYTSYTAQVSYYTEYIQRNPEWQFVDIYTDEGITGTSTKYREGFNRMIEDALNGQIDLITSWCMAARLSLVKAFRILWQNPCGID